MKTILRMASLSLLLASHAFATPLSSCEDASDLPSVASLGAAVHSAAGLYAPPSGRVGFRVEGGRWTNDAAMLFEGAPLELVSSPARFPKCGNSNVTGYVRTDDGQILTVPMGGYDVADNRYGSVSLPAGTRSVDVWFKSESFTSDRYGSNVQSCVEWDSNFGRNYSFPVNLFEPSVATFAAGASPSLSEPLRAGGAIAFDYDPARVTGCRTSHLGHPTWGVRAYARFSDGSVKAADIVLPGDRDARHPSIGIPDGATKADVWFENYGLYPGEPANACKSYDSNGGANYSFNVQ